MVMKKTCHILALFIIIFLAAGSNESELTVAEGTSPDYVTAILGQWVVLNCNIEFPDGVPVPYIVQWSKQGDKVPIYIWYAGYPPHIGDGYKDRISLVNLASINISDIQESDQGWYQCNILFLNRRPESNKNGTWVYLEVHAPPHFTVTPQEVYYVKYGDSLVLTCEADGTPKPNVIWRKLEKPLEPSGNVQLCNDGHEVRITNIRQADIGDYTCEASNNEGHIYYHTRIIVAGGAVITTPPQNITKLEGSKAEFICVASALPGNITYKWYRNDVDIVEHPWLVSRTVKKNDKMLVIDPLKADDSGKYTCEVTNGIGTPQSASAYLDVEYAARVSYTPSLQYLPLGLSGVIRCHFDANPPIQFITWYKNKRLYVPEEQGITRLTNGSLLIKTVTQDDQGLYTCTPYNSQGTEGPSGVMEVLVREPPKFVKKPKESYQSTVNGEVTMPCEAQGNPKPEVAWRRADGHRLPKDRIQIRGGNLTLKFLRKTDYGYYECVVQNEVATLVTSSLLIVESTTPHAPTNISVNTSASSATVSWLPAYDGGYTQNYVVWHRESNYGDASWRMIRVTNKDATSLTIYNLTPNTSYDFRVLSWNKLGESLRSPIVKGTTKSSDPVISVYPTDLTGYTSIPTMVKPAGPTAHTPSYDPTPPHNVTATLDTNGLTVTWSPPAKASADILYEVEYRTDSSSNWSSLSAFIRAPNLTYTLSKPVAGKTYYFRVIARTFLAASLPSEVVQLSVPSERKDAGPRPSPPRNVTVEEVNDGIRISWAYPPETLLPATYYIVEYNIEGGGWFQAGGQIRGTSYLFKSPMGGKTYFFRVYTKTSQTMSIPTDTVKFNVPIRFKDKAITAGVVGGILFFIVAIILSICAVKICNKRKRRRQERAYSMVACRVTDMRNGGHGPAGSPVPLRKFTESRVSGVNISALRRKVTRFTRLALGLGDGVVGSRWSNEESLRSYTSNCIPNTAQQQSSSSSNSWIVDSRFDFQRRPLFSASSSSLRHHVTSRRQRRELSGRQQSSQRRFPKSAKYQVHMEYSQPAGYISRSPDGRFQLYDHQGVDGLYGDEELSEVAITNTRANPSGQQQWSPYHQNYYTNQQQHPKPWAIAPNQQQQHLSSSSLMNSSKAWDRTPDIHTIYSPRDPKFRTSSPGPLAHYRARNFPVEDISSVLLPSSVERSFPAGTISSNSQHHFSPSFSPVDSNNIFSPSCELPSLRILHGQLPNIREEEDQRYKTPQVVNHNNSVVDDNYDHPPIRRPIPVAWYPIYQRSVADEQMQDIEEKPPPRPPRYTQREPPPRPIEPPPPVPDIKQRQMPRRQLDAYMRIQAQDEESPLATSSPPCHDRRIARVPPSPAIRDNYDHDSCEFEIPVSAPYTRDRLIAAVTQVRQQGGAYRLNMDNSNQIETQQLQPFVGNVTVTVPDVSIRTGDEGDSTMTSDEAFHTLGVVGVTPSSRVSVTSAGTGSSGRGSKPASVSHSRGDSLQGELQEYSPTCRSSSSGFASRNTSQSQTSPHQMMIGSISQAGGQATRSITSQPSRPLPPLNVSTDENYEFDSASPLEIPSTAENVKYSSAVEKEDENAMHAVETPASSVDDADKTTESASDNFSNFSKVSKYDDMEIQRRIPALKQEFQQFRKRQRERFNDDLMESEC